MSIIKVGQNFTLTLDTTTDLSTASPLRIDYKDPNGVTGQKTASVVDTNKARINILSSENTKNGDWKFEVFATISGATYIGTTFTQPVLRSFE